MDSLEISGLWVKTKIGVHAWEQQILQRLLIDIAIPINANSNEDIATHVDYDKLCQFTVSYLENNTFKLIETVAELLASQLKLEFNLSSIRLKVSKPHAIKNASNICVIINR